MEDWKSFYNFHVKRGGDDFYAMMSTVYEEEVYNAIENEIEVELIGLYNTNLSDTVTNSIIEAGKGEDEWNIVDCDSLVEREGYDRKYVHNLIEECENKNMY